jgi:hypothetical protein
VSLSSRLELCRRYVSSVIFVLVQRQAARIFFFSATPKAHAEMSRDTIIDRYDLAYKVAFCVTDGLASVISGQRMNVRKSIPWSFEV